MVTYSSAPWRRTRGPVYAYPGVQLRAPVGGIHPSRAPRKVSEHRVEYRVVKSTCNVWVNDQRRFVGPQLSIAELPVPECTVVRTCWKCVG